MTTGQPGRGLDEVLPAQRREAAAQDRHVGQAVVEGHFAQRVAQPHIGLARRAHPLAAPRHAQARVFAQALHLVEALRVARHDQPLHGHARS
jgi:hypothetical protein